MEYFTFILGLIVGGLIVLIFHHRITASGELLIDHTDPEKDIYRINVNNLDDLSKKKRVILKVDNNAKLRYTSRK